MDDTSAPVPLSREQMDKFLEAIKVPFKEHEDERRRSLEISAGFFEKLAALDAATIALAASIILAIVFKPELRADFTHPILHKIFTVLIFLWCSFVLAILHNALIAIIAHLEAAYSETEFVWALMKESLSATKENVGGLTDEQVGQVEDTLRAQIHPKQRRLIAVKTFLYPTVKVVGGLSILTFLAAYTLIPYFLHKLW